MLRARDGARREGMRGVLLVGLMLVVVGVGMVVSVEIRGRRALERAGKSAITAGQIDFRTLVLDLSPARVRGVGFEAVAARAEFTSGVFFDGALYLAGPRGLTRMNAEGRPTLELRTGFELPVAAITGMAAGRVRGAGGPELLIATAGAGLLVLEPRAGGLPAVRDVLPADADARELTAVLPLESGDVLLGTRHRGLLLYSGSRLSRQVLPVAGVDSGKLQITALAAVDAGSYLVGTRDAGVFYMSGGTVRQAKATTGLPDDEVESIAVADGHAFVGTPMGTAEFDLAADNWMPVRTLAPGVFGHALTADEHELLVGTIDQGVREIPLGEHANLRRVAIGIEPGSSATGRVDAFLPAGKEIYALADGRLLRRDKTEWTPMFSSAAGTLSDGNISALEFAPDGTLYVGFFDHGIDMLSPQGVVKHLEDDHLFCINRLALDPDRHTIAAATGDGLVLFDATGVPRQTLMRRDGLISNHVTDIAFTPRGTALATPAGITFLGPTGPESLYAFQGLVNNHVYALAISPNGLIAGTLGGLSVLKDKTVQRSFTVNNSTLKHNWITALLTMPQGVTLVGTYGAGLETLDAQGHFAPIESPNGTPRDLVINPNALFATSTHLYAGTLGHGMLVYSQAAGRWSAITAGLPSLNVTSFAARNGELYIGTDNGLERIAEANLP
jgi:ligand-binding sensor domain-containing protein